MNNRSPAAYRLLRSTFSDRIPAPITMRCWLMQSDINPKSGILKQSLEILKRKAQEKSAAGEKLVGGLLWDEMSIRSALQWTKNEMTGFENLPGMTIDDRKNAKIATEVILFMFSAINDDLKIPVAYFFTAPTNSDARNSLVKEVVSAVLKSGIHLTSITFDGHRSNPGACTTMGANLDVFSPDFDPTIVVENTKINIILDPSHMMKMLRGSLGKDLSSFMKFNCPFCRNLMLFLTNFIFQFHNQF